MLKYGISRIFQFCIVIFHFDIYIFIYGVFSSNQTKKQQIVAFLR
jgi:hypothetical protein